MALGAMLLDTVAMKTKKVIIRNLFGRYNYELNLTNNKTSIIYGYNGYGKTTILNLLTAILNLDYKVLDKILFDEVTMFFENHNNSKKLTVINMKNDNPRFRYIFNDKNYDVEVKYTEHLSDNSKRKYVKKEYIYNSELKNIFEKNMIQEAYFISADRIYRNYDLKYNERVDSCIVYTRLHINRIIRNICIGLRKNYLENKSKRMISRSELIKTASMIDVLKKNGWLSTLFELKKNVDLIESICTKDINDLSKSEEKYLKEWYLKLSAFFDNPNFIAVELFINILNDNFFKFGNKRVGIDGGYIKVIYHNIDYYSSPFPLEVKDNDNIPLDSLSSAEKNLFVLFYELIFKLKERKLVMIDEPEISLHIYAQERILDIIDSIVNYDIDSINNYFKKNTGLSQKDFKRRIVNDFVPLYGIQVLIATHSPNICKNHEDNMIELKSLQ